jgi:beta-glucanase (GH16 family)
LTRRAGVGDGAATHRKELEILRRLAAPTAVLGIALLIVLATPSQASAAWRLRFAANFRHGLNTKIWTRYDGTPRCCHQTRWRPSHVVVKGGILRLQNYRDRAYGGRWVSAGVSMGRSLNQTYGKYRVRFRMTKGHGIGMCMLLWPAHGWPPEVDFAEESSSVGARRFETSTLHFGRHNSEIHHRVHANFTRWHTIGVNWRPGKLVYTLDGHAWARTIGPEVPDVPMHLGLQTHVGTNGNTGSAPDSATPAKVGLQIDWIKVYRYR